MGSTFIFLGFVLMAVSSYKSHTLSKLLNGEILKNTWRTMVIMVFLFTIAYAGIFLTTITGSFSYAARLSALVFLGGSFFVFMAIRISTQMNFIILEQMKNLEFLIQKATKGLEEAQKIAHIGSLEIDPTTGQSSWSEEVFRILELDPKKDQPGVELYFSLLHPEDRETVKNEMAAALKAHAPFGGDRRIITRSGRLKHVFSKNVPEPNNAGTGVIYRGIILDVTERKNAEERNREQEKKIAQNAKMASLGEMAGGVAHEVNTPLAIIKMNVERALKSISTHEAEVDWSKLRKSLDVIDATTDRIAKIVRGMSLFSRNHEKSPFIQENLSRIIDETLSFYQEKIKTSGINFIYQVPQNNIIVECRPEQISQVLLNLLNNAHDAVVGLDDKWIRLELFDAGDVVKIVVVDSGRGIDESIKNKIMQPFFTTKEIGKGTGLGLSVSKGIIESHGGSISLNTDSTTTTFEVILPKKQIRQI